MTGVVVLVLRLLATAALLAFLGLALWLSWQELQLATASLRGHVPPIRLEIQTRGRQPSLRSFMQPEIVLGRDPLADIALTDKGVSARHARISYHHGQWWLEDLDSTNGTRLNRETLRTPTVLTTGDEVKCGATKLMVSIPGDATQPAWEKRPDE